MEIDSTKGIDPEVLRRGISKFLNTGGLHLGDGED